MVEFGNLPKPSTFSNQCNCAQVLIVDDNPFNTLAFETILEALDVKFDSVYNAKDSIEKILSRSKQVCGKGCQPYSLVFMDQEMPGMTGSEAVREIRKLESKNLIPVLRIMGCTAHGGWNEVEKFMESGINRCIHKPISIELIKEVLTEAGIKFKSREKIG